MREHALVIAAAREGERFETRTDALAVDSRFLVNSAGIGAGKVAAWFGEDVPLGPVVPNMLVTEPLPIFVTRSVGVCGGDVYVRQVSRGNVIIGGGGGWGDAELAPFATDDRPVAHGHARRRSIWFRRSTARTSSGPGPASTARCPIAFR